MASNITVEITSPEGGTLNTAGKYCEGDINVTPKLQSKKITENGEVYPDDGHAGLSRVVVNVQPKLQEKTVTENGEVTPDEGYDGLSKVTVNVATSTKSNEFGIFKSVAGAPVITVETV